MDIATTRNMANKPVGVRDKDAYAEEPCNPKGLRTVLKGDGRGRLRPSTHHISGCFNNLDHELLLTTLGEHIHDGRFLNLIRGLLDAGYLEDWTFHRTLSGVPQGSIVSPVLSNILLNRLDRFVEDVLIPRYTKGVNRRRNPAYIRLESRIRRAFKKGAISEATVLRRERDQLPAGDPNDPQFRRLKFVRYADDFLLGFIGPKSEAEDIKRELETFLRDQLKLELSAAKTLITHARTGAARFLGYDITTIQDDRKRHPRRGRSVNGHIGLRVPRDVLKEKCSRYRHGKKPSGKVMHRPELEDDSDFTILSLYQREYRGIVEYYRLAYNLHRLDYLKWIMEQSLTKTLAHKFKTSVQKVCDRYKAEWDVEGSAVKGFQTLIPREGRTPLVARWGGVSLKWDIKADLNDRLPKTLAGRTELEQRLLAQVCELCGATRATDSIEVHHIRALKDLNRYTGREKPAWVMRMAGRRRKTLVLCRTCHQDIQYGRPVRRRPQASRSSTAVSSS
jgi:Reverse transcriptase (RNA-dependent DNA polymerase)/Type II intron maturase